MPSYCYNDVRVQGPSSEMRRFIQITIRNQPDNVFNPEAVTEPENWGSVIYQDYTSTNRADVDLVEICIDSNWRPPLGLFRRASEIYPRLVFSILYKIDDDDNGGMSVFKGGECLYEDKFNPLVRKYDGEIPVVQDDDDQWVQADTMEPIPGVSQDDVYVGIILMNPLTFDDFDAEAYVSESEEEEEQLPFNGLDIVPIQLIGDNNPFSVIDESVVCPICLKQPENPVASKCSHVFCSSCIQHWTDMFKTECPYCRQPL